jgi:hypothetical protein
MRKLTALLGITLMALSVILPVTATPPTTQNATGGITYALGGVTDPVKIVAIWEVVNASTPVADNNLLKPGCQVNPPLVFDHYSTVWVYVAFQDPNHPRDIDNLNQIKVDISWPNNGGRTALGVGGLKADNIEPVQWATWKEYTNAHENDTGQNHPYICYYDGARDSTGLEEYDYVSHAHMDSDNIFFAKVPYQLYYHDPAGWYDAEVTISHTHMDIQKNYFEYVLLNGIQLDFTKVNFGTKNSLNTWYDAPGDYIFDSVEPTPSTPTIRNIGDWDTILGVDFSNGTFAPQDVLFNIRIGDSNPTSSHYNQSYLEAHGNPTDKIQPNVDTAPLPIYNGNELVEKTKYNDMLLKCHTAKIIFYIYVKQFTKIPWVGEYTFNIELISTLPSDPALLPVNQLYFPYPS